MAGLFSSGEQDLVGNIMSQRQQANQALGSGYGKYGGIVQAAGGLIDTGTDAMFGGKVGAADPRMQQLQGAKAIFAKVAKEMVDVKSPAFFKRLAQEFQAAGFPEQAQKAEEQASALEVRDLTMKEKEATIASMQAKTAKTEAEAEATKSKISARTLTLASKFPKLTSSEIQAIAEDDASFRTYIKPPKDYTPSDYAKLLIEGGVDPESDEFKNKIAAWSEARLKAEQTKNKADLNAVAVQQAQVELDRAKFKAEGERRKQAEAVTKARLKQLTGASHVKMITNRIDTAVGLISEDTVGWKALILKDLPETKARALKNKLDVIKGNIGFDRLQQMRDASPTGGALGQVAVQELYALQNSIDSLDQLQTGAELKQALDNIKAQYESYVKNQRASMEANEPLLGTPESEAILAELQARRSAPAPAAAPTAPAAGSGVTVRNWK